MLHRLQKTGIVIPCYNEALRLPVGEFVEFLKEFPSLRFCFVNDGSTDNTSEVLESLSKEFQEQVTVLDLKQNHGKAEAVRNGIHFLSTSSAFDFVGYWDADLSTPLWELPRFLEVARSSSDIEFICGSRVRRMGATIERRTSRHYMGRTFATAVGLLLSLPVYDTQCGSKLISIKLATGIFREPFVSSWFFDVEIFVRVISRLGHDRAKRTIFELPLTEWYEKKGSKLSLLDYLRAPLDLLLIARYYKLF